MHFTVDIATNIEKFAFILLSATNVAPYNTIHTVGFM
jgi:hypothetical protein